MCALEAKAAKEYSGKWNTVGLKYECYLGLILHQYPGDHMTPVMSKCSKVILWIFMHLPQECRALLQQGEKNTMKQSTITAKCKKEEFS